MSLSKKAGKYLWLIPALVSAALLAACGAKPVSTSEHHGITMDIKKCRRMKGDLECIFYVKTQGKKTRFRILRDSPNEPTAKDDKQNSYVASEVYINGVGYLNKWVYMGAFKSMPGLIVYPGLADKARVVTEIDLTMNSDLVKDTWHTQFSNIPIQ